MVLLYSIDIGLKKFKVMHLLLIYYRLPLCCTPSCRFFSICIRFRLLWKDDHCKFVKRDLTGFILITAYMNTICELSTIGLSHALHKYFRLNNKLVYATLSYHHTKASLKHVGLPLS